MKESTTPYRDLFDTTIGDTISQALRIIGADPSLVLPGTIILSHQKKAASIRKKHEAEGLLVPPVMIVSITSRCNLTCAGCYMQGRKHADHTEMSADILASVVNQAADLGVSIIVIAGGEPFMRYEEILRIAQSHPRVLFPVFTNGMLIDEPMASAIASCKNIVPIISFEGFREETDARRGQGIYDRLLKTCTLLKEKRVFFGCSITITRNNFNTVTSEAFISEMLKTKIRVFAYVEYVPMTPGTEEHILTDEQKSSLQEILAEMSRRFPALFIGFPGDEDYYGGCLAAGRGFVHVSPSGDLEPCPAAPYSDANLTSVSLKEALQSRFLGRLRQTPEILTESGGGCALRAHQTWVQEIISQD